MNHQQIKYYITGLNELCKSTPVSLLVIVFLLSILSYKGCKSAVDFPVVTTANITIITQTTASGGGTISYDGGAEITSKGICWSTNHNPSEADTKTTDGTGTASFKSSLKGLSQRLKYSTSACSPSHSRSHSHTLLLTHLGSNQDSAEPKSDVLPITPWVSIYLKLQN